LLAYGKSKLKERKTAMIKITPENYQKMQKKLDEVQKGCQARKANMKDVLGSVEDTEKSMKDSGIPKKYWYGTQVILVPEKMPNAYKAKAMGTSYTLEYRKSGWYFMKCSRVSCGNAPYGSYQHDRIIPKFKEEDIHKVLGYVLKQYGISF